jgi:hypothetical protein
MGRLPVASFMIQFEHNLCFFYFRKFNTSTVLLYFLLLYTVHYKL